MLWGGRWEGGSCLGTHVRIKDFKIKKIKKLKKKTLLPVVHSSLAPSPTKPLSLPHQTPSPSTLPWLPVNQPCLTPLPPSLRPQKTPGKPLVRLFLWPSAHVISPLPLITKLLIKLAKSPRPTIVSSYGGDISAGLNF